MKIIIPGNPISQARHRSFLRGGIINSYDPQSKEKKDIKKYISYQLSLALNGSDKKIQLEAASLSDAQSFQAELHFHMPIPYSFSNSKRNRLLWGIDPMCSKPDLDNLAKFYLDCANEVLYSDDSKITKLLIKKLYSNKPKTVMFILKNDTNMIHATIEDIIQMISPHEFVHLTETIYELNQRLVDITEGNYSYDKGDHPEQLAQAACLLSELSNYTPLLAKIKKKYGNFHKEYKNITQRKENFYDKNG